MGAIMPSLCDDATAFVVALAAFFCRWQPHASPITMTEFNDLSLQPIPPTPAIRRTRIAAVALLLALVVLLVAWELWLAPVRPGGSWLALKALPLCLPLAGLLKNRMYTYRWLSLMVWIYFCEGAVRAWSDRAPSSYYALLEAILCVALFVACAMHIRLRFKAARQLFAATLAQAEADAGTQVASAEASATTPAASQQA